MPKIKIEQFKQYLAVFKPIKLKTLKDELIPYIGKELIVEAVGIIEQGIYEDQWMFEVQDKINSIPIISLWIPEEDLEIIKEL
jgi:hypothetical protein